MAVLQVGLLVGSLLAPALARRLSRRWKSPLSSALTAGSLVLGGHTVIALLERRSPYRPDWNVARDNDVMVDSTYHFAQSPVALSLSGVLVAVVSALLPRRGGEDSRGSRLVRAPLALRLALALAVSEWSHYWWHRTGHGRGWRWHSVHHSAQRLYWLNALRFHFVDSLMDGVTQGIPLTLFGFDAETMLAHNVFAGVYGQIQHANVSGDSGWLRHLFATPEIHRWHHSTDYSEGNSNFGARLSLWDRVFGTYFFPMDRAFDAEIGVGGMSDFPTTYRAQLTVPFRWPVEPR